MNSVLPSGGVAVIGYSAPLPAGCLNAPVRRSDWYTPSAVPLVLTLMRQPGKRCLLPKEYSIVKVSFYHGALRCSFFSRLILCKIMEPKNIIHAS